MLKAQLVGNIGSDPEMRYTANGDGMLRFNVVSNGRVRTAEGAWQDETTWVRVTVFGKRVDTLNQYLRKGSRVYVDGRLEARPWTDSRGEIKAGLELMANDVEFMSSRQDGEGSQTSAPPTQTRHPATAGNTRGDDGELPF